MDANDYINNIPESRKTRFLEISKLIEELYPDAERSMEYRMPTYRNDKGWIAIANQKQYISLYTCGLMHIESFKREHPEIKTGKGCINFKDKDEIPLSDLRPVIKSAMGSNH